MKLKTSLLFFAANRAMSAPALADDTANREIGTEAKAEAEAKAKAKAKAAQPSANAKPPVEIFSTGMAKGRDRLGSATSTSTLKGDDIQRFGPRQTQNGYFAYGRGATGLFRRIFDVDYSVVAPYGSVNFHIGKLAIGGSLRYDSGKTRGQLFGLDLGGGRVGQTTFDFNRDGAINPAEARTAILPLDRPAPVNYDYGYLNYSVGANYRVADAFSVFARYSRGGRASADKILFTPLVDPLSGGVATVIQEDFVTQLEGGFKLRRNGVTGNAAVFHVEAEDRNVLGGAASSTDRTYVAKGAELEGTITCGVFNLMLAATYTRAKITEDRIGGVFTGKQPRHQPDWVFVAVPQLDFGKFAAGANIVTITGSFAQDNNQLRMPGHTQVGAFVEAEPAENLRLTVRAQNLLGTLGIFEVNQSTVPAGGVGFARAANGRTVQASLALSF